MIDNSKEDDNLSKRIDIFNILDENIEPNKELTWREELVQVKERYDNFDIDKMCARCIKEQYELGIKNSEGELITPIRCTGIYSFKNDTVSKYGEDIYNSMVDMMTAEQLDIAETTVNPLKWLGSTIADKKLFSPRNYQTMMSSCSARYKVFRCGRRIGKSFTMTVGALHRLVSRDNYRVLMVAPQDTMIKEIVELIERFCNAMEVNPIVHQTQSPIHQITFNTGSTFKGVTAGANKAKAVRGKGGDLVILDECFPAKTQITMWDGTTKSISEIKKGDRVLSYDEVKNQLVIKRVTEARCNGKKDVYTFITVSGKKIHCTAEHPLWTREGWVPAFEAKSVATTKTKTGEYFFEGIIGSRYKSNELVYNFEVKDTHTYIADDFIVHNCDYLDPDAFTAILALLMDNADVEFWASSTPNGESILYKLANDPAYKEFHLPSFVVPQYTDELDKMFKSKLDDTGYNQEVRANFNSSRDGVYPLNFIKQATVKDEIIINKDYVKQNRKDCILIMGVDWNHDKVGTRIVIVCYDKLSGRYVILHKDKISKEGWSQPLAVEKIVQLNREFDLDHIYVDEGFGVAQTSQLRLFAQQQFGKVPARHPDLKLAKVVAVKFGSSLDVKDPVSGEDYKKQTKQYMVEHSVDILTRGLIILHEENDADIIAQMKNYIVKNKSATGLKTFGYVDTQIADHDLDAYNLALHGFHQEYSEFVNTGPIVGVSNLLKQAPIQLDDQVSIVSHSTSMIINTRESFLKNKFRKGRTSQFKTRKVW